MLQRTAITCLLLNVSKWICLERWNMKWMGNKIFGLSTSFNIYVMVFRVANTCQSFAFANYFNLACNLCYYFHKARCQAEVFPYLFLESSIEERGCSPPSVRVNMCTVTSHMSYSLPCSLWLQLVLIRKNVHTCAVGVLGRIWGRENPWSMIKECNLRFETNIWLKGNQINKKLSRLQENVGCVLFE